jgi:hypothetical protein
VTDVIPNDEPDAADNPAIRECLTALRHVYAQFTAGAPSKPFMGATSLAGLALALRRKVEEGLRATSRVTDFDPMALGALQEALRTFVNPRASGFQVTLDEVAEAFQHFDLPTLWGHFATHYLGNVFEWQRSAGDQPGDDARDVWAEVTTFRQKVAPELGEEMRSILVQSVQSGSPMNVDEAVRSLTTVLLAE